MKRVWSTFGAAILIGALMVPAQASADPASAPAPLPGGTWTAVTPHRVVDTRVGLGASAHPTTVVSADGASAGVPNSGVAALAATVTVVDATKPGYVYQDDLGRPGVASRQLTVLSFVPGHSTAGFFIAAAGIGARSASAFAIHSSTPVNFVVDILGYFSTADSAATSGRYVAVTPARVLDTRRSGVPLCAHCTTSVRVVGAGLVPAGAASSVVVNTTAVGSTGPGYLTTYGPGARPGTSTLLHAAGQTVADRAIVPIGSDGTIHVYNGGSATHLLIDLSGYFTSGTQAGAYYVPVGGARLLDTRQRGSGRLYGLTAVDAAGDEVAPLPLLSAVTRPVAAVATLTATHSVGGWAVMFADGTRRPPVSDLEATAGVTQTALVTPSFGSDGRFGLYSSAPSHYVLDVFGYFALPAATPPHGAWAYGYAGLLQADTGANFTQTPVPLVDGAATRWVGTDTHYRYELHTDGTLDRIDVSCCTSQSIHRLFTGAIAVATLDDGGIALRSDGTVWAWGTNDALGRPGVTTSANPIEVPGISDAVTVATGSDQAYAVRADGTVLAWGANMRGELGDGTTTAHASPEPVPGVSGVAKVVRTLNATYAVHTDGTLSRWGYWTGAIEQLTATTLPLPCTGANVAWSGDDYVLCTDGSVRVVNGGQDSTNALQNGVPSGVIDIASDASGGYPVLLLADGTVWRVDDSHTFQPIAGIAQIAGISGSSIVAMWTAS